MTIKDKLDRVSDKVNLFSELSLRDKLQNKLIVFGVNIFNWIKNILLKIRNVFKLIHIYLLTRKKELEFTQSKSNFYKGIYYSNKDHSSFGLSAYDYQSIFK